MTDISETTGLTRVGTDKADVTGKICFSAEGLVPAIAQQHDTGEVLMMAWMNAAALAETLQTGRVCYWSRSRRCLWRKGETSGHHQRLIACHLDCDGDALLLLIDQTGAACHTGERSCFFQPLDADVLALPGMEQLDHTRQG